MAEDAMLREAMEAVAQGQRRRARDLLTRLLRADQTNTTYWLWMSSVVDTSKERIFCLRNVLKYEPGNRAAQRGLILLGELPAPDSVAPLPPLRRKWVVAEEESQVPTGLQRLYANPFLRMIIFTAILVVGFVLIGYIGFGIGGRKVTLTITPIPWTQRPTETPVPTKTVQKTDTPTFEGPIPLILKLPATYTPTPLYVNTPHPVSEAYRAGLRAFYDGDLSGFLRYMQQAVNLEPNSTDIYFYIGEAYRLKGDFQSALEAYEETLELDPNFAPAYLGRVRINLIINPKANVKPDLDEAIKADSTYGEAYLERGEYFLRNGEFDSALDDLLVAERLLPGSPLVYLGESQVYLALGNATDALAAAQKAHDLDITLLPAYLALGQAYIQDSRPGEGVTYLNTYTVYDDKNADAWAALGEALFQSGGNTQQALQAFDKANAIDKNLPEVYYYRGLIHLSLGDSKAAIVDLELARRAQPADYTINLAFGRALLLDDRPGDAIPQFNVCEKLAETDEQLAEVSYWRAQAYEANGNGSSAALDWEALLKSLSTLPADSQHADWQDLAKEHLLALTPSPTPVTPTDTPTVTRTPRPTFTPTATRTPRPTFTPTATRTPRPTPTPTFTRTPRPTYTFTMTASPEATATPVESPDSSPTATRTATP
jgi:tetratricopeptide (TPR) repeat protein